MSASPAPPPPRPTATRRTNGAPTTRSTGVVASPPARRCRAPDDTPRPGAPPTELVDQRLRERRPRPTRDARLTERLQAHVVGARVEVRAHDLRDLFGAALRDHGVD